MNDESKLVELKRQLREEASKPLSDTGIILTLSNEIAKLDQSEVRFSVDAAIINRLGKELVGRHETAVSELVKNAYDADSTEVSLVFENAYKKGGTLTISDDGLGMTRLQLIDGFMRLSSSEKVHNPQSPRYNRTRAGRKGIGRFATQRLGTKLTIITQTLSSDIATKIEIDWDTFLADRDLSTIGNKIVELPKEKLEGTDLIIDGLRDEWSDPMIKRVYRYTSDLLQPFPLSKKRKEREEDRVDPGFRSSYFRKTDNNLIKVIDEEEAFLKSALAEIEGFVLDNGQGCWTLKSEKLGINGEEVYDIGGDEKDPKTPFKLIRDVHFKCYYFIYDDEFLSPQQKTFIREVGNEQGGLRLYRNGFRVLPYGEKGNDWIRLDESVRRRVILPAHANNSFFGFVEISDEAGLTYEETSSREGLIENDAFSELTNFIFRTIIGAVLRVAALRGRKGKASQKGWKKEEQSASEKVDFAISQIRQAIGNKHDIKSGKDQEKDGEIDKVIDELIESREIEKEEKRRLIDEVNLLRVLAGLGIAIGEFVHEVRRFLPAFDTDIKYLKRVVKGDTTAEERIERLDTNIRAFTIYTSYFDKAVSRNVQRTLEPIELRDAVADFLEVIDNDIVRTGIKFEKPKYEGIDLFTEAMHPSEWASILFNFYTNSKKAIRRSGNRGKIFIKCGLTGDNVFLEFSDNGDGIKKDYEDSIFNAFFTTSGFIGQSASEIESLTGTGLGLKIVKDIVTSYGGDVFVTSTEPGYSTTIRIEIPKFKK